MPIALLVMVGKLLSVETTMSTSENECTLLVVALDFVDPTFTASPVSLVLMPPTAKVSTLLLFSTFSVLLSLEQLVINTPGIASIAIATTQFALLVRLNLILVLFSCC